MLSTLTKKELTLLAEAQPNYDIYLHEVPHEGERWWSMQVRLSTQQKTFELVTALGKPKLWRHLDIAVDFVQETCQTKQVMLVFDSSA